MCITEIINLLGYCRHFNHVIVALTALNVIAIIRDKLC